MIGRGTKEVALYIGNAQNGPWTLMAELTLADPTIETGTVPLVIHKLPAPSMGQAKAIDLQTQLTTHY